ncbi:MAG: Extradiol ring-cleavage dioxygenase [Gammaproteobacteria bacterium]|jgi:4,5-DOPA dioxygenase extradiol|nr:Extradiol ring-cleavage dioxygenase [Gammaproteobacteria bacterium]
MLMPALFISHGTPLVALLDDNYTQALTELGQQLDTPRAIVVMSAHGLSHQGVVEVTASLKPQLIYDFSGFPTALYQLQYPCPGSPQLAQQLVAQLSKAGIPAVLNSQAGLDHGVWIPLLRLFPSAQIPVIQISLPYPSSLAHIFNIGQALQSLRQEGVLLIGSGSATHNLSALNWQNLQSTTDTWATTFMTWLKQKIQQDSLDQLFSYQSLAPYVTKAHPTAEHFYPLFFTLGGKTNRDVAEILTDSYYYGNLSMFSFILKSAG